ncbi:MAG: CHASE4 domain-containing protein [Planctomycetota bacterium]
MIPLRRRILVLLSCLAGCFLAATWWIQQQQLLPSFLELERQHALADLQRGTEALRNELGFVGDYVSDWSGWDDTYQFVIDRNEAFAKSNLETDVFRENSFDMLAIVGLDGSEVWRGAKVDGQDLAIAELPNGKWPHSHPMLAPKGLTDVASGIVVTAHGAMMLASMPITDSARKAEPRGWIMMGRFLTPSRLAKLRKQTRLDLSISPVREPSTGARRAEAQQLLATDHRLVERGEQLVAQTVFPGMRGADDALLLEVAEERSILEQGQHTLSFALASTTFAVLLLFAVLAGLLQQMVIGPLQRLTRHALGIRSSGDLTRRSGVLRRDEIGTLANEFDGMVERLAALQSQQVQQARVGGMAEVARSVLHDVGNALQPVQGNLGVAQARLGSNLPQDLERVTDMMLAHAKDLGTWLSTDQKGQRVPGFLRALSASMKTERDELQRELCHLGDGLKHIQHLVGAQQRHVAEGGAVEFVDARALLDEAVRMSRGPQDDGVQFAFVVQREQPLAVEKHRLLAVLINLLRNARHAVRDVPAAARIVTIEVGDAGPERVRITVRDGGVGISSENLARIFHAGFSTRSGGQGLGLHGCANSVGEMGGKLWAESDGPGQGARFHVELPLRSAQLAEARS